jgi:hypothetical protein
MIAARGFVLTSGEAVLFAALLAGILAIIGGITGIVYGSHREQKHWLRETRRKAYERMLAASYRMQGMETVNEMVATLAKLTTRETPITIEEVEADLHNRIATASEMLAAASAVQIAGPTNIGRVAAELKNELLKTSADKNVDAIQAEFIAMTSQILGTE